VQLPPQQLPSEQQVQLHIALLWQPHVSLLCSRCMWRWLALLQHTHDPWQQLPPEQQSHEHPALVWQRHSWPIVVLLSLVTSTPVSYRWVCRLVSFAFVVQVVLFVSSLKDRPRDFILHHRNPKSVKCQATTRSHFVFSWWFAFNS